MILTLNFNIHILHVYYNWIELIKMTFNVFTFVHTKIIQFLIQVEATCQCFSILKVLHMLSRLCNRSFCYNWRILSVTLINVALNSLSFKSSISYSLYLLEKSSSIASHNLCNIRDDLVKSPIELIYIILWLIWMRHLNPKLYIVKP